MRLSDRFKGEMRRFPVGVQGIMTENAEVAFLSQRSDMMTVRTDFEGVLCRE